MGLVDVSLLLLAVLALCYHIATTNDLEMTKVSIDSVATSRFLSPLHFGLLRSLLALSIWSTCLYMLCDKEGLTLNILMRDGSTKVTKLLYAERFTPFTVWCWLLQGVYFTTASYLSFKQHYAPKECLELSPLVAQGTWILFEVSFSVAFLVSAVVTYVLIPTTVKRGLPLDTFYKFLPVLFHNANVAYMALELVLNNLAFSPHHFIFVILYGVAYVLFAWFWFQVKGVFYYFFLDYARDWAILWHLGLLIAVGLFFFLGLLLSSLLESNNPFALVALVGITVGVMKFPPSASTSSPTKH